MFPHHGLSISILSDRDPKFTSEFFQEVFTILGTHLCVSTANHPQTDDLTERINRVVKDTLRTFVSHRQNDWDNFLPLCQFAINNARQSSNDHTPFFLNHGYDPLTPSSLVDLRTSLDLEKSEDDPILWTKRRMEALASARDALTAAQARKAFYSDRGRVELNVGVGDQVLVHREFLVTPEARARPCHKLRSIWFGPFKVVERISANAFSSRPASYPSLLSGVQRYSTKEVFSLGHGGKQRSSACTNHWPRWKWKIYRWRVFGPQKKANGFAVPC